jgi:hypothetical protein
MRTGIDHLGQELSAEKTGGGWRVELAGRAVEAAYLDQAIAELLGVRSGEAVPGDEDPETVAHRGVRRTLG